MRGSAASHRDSRVECGTVVHIGHMELEVVGYPLYAHAHPGEPCESDELCRRCALARRPDTGEIVLLWLAGEKDWTVSRADPQWQRHREELYREVAHA